MLLQSCWLLSCVDVAVLQKPTVRTEVGALAYVGPLVAFHIELVPELLPTVRTVLFWLREGL